MTARRWKISEPSGTPVRWKQSGRWRYGHADLEAREADGSLRIYDTYTGGTRSLPVPTVQHQTEGPRGGRRWDWITPPGNGDTGAPGQERPGWRPPPGRADLYNQEPLFGGLTVGAAP